MDEFSHLDEKANATMVDVSSKELTKRTAIAMSIVHLPGPAFEQLSRTGMHSKKGAVFQTAILAGIMAAKKTGELIPLCHSLGLENCKITVGTNEKEEIIIHCTASVTSRTGVEMEALVGASVAALTIYDMCKALSHDIVISEIKLLEKSGGKNEYKRTP